MFDKNNIESLKNRIKELESTDWVSSFRVREIQLEDKKWMDVD